MTFHLPNLGASGSVILPVLALALAIDFFLGEFPAPVHPVVWIGKSVGTLLRLVPASGRYRQLFFGFLLAVIIVFASGTVAWFLTDVLSPYPILEVLVGAFLLKS